jgi:hypothetical protein
MELRAVWSGSATPEDATGSGEPDEHAENARADGIARAAPKSQRLRIEASLRGVTG